MNDTTLTIGPMSFDATPDVDSSTLRPIDLKTAPSPVFTLVVPIYNDGVLASALCAELEQVFKGYFSVPLNSALEVIFIDDGSANNSFAILRELQLTYPFVKSIELSRNFGQHIALSCGLKHASGQYVGIIDVDMQDPPSELPRLLDQFQLQDCDVVSGVRLERKDSIIKSLTSDLFMSIFYALTGFAPPPGHSTLRLFNRRYVDAFNLYTEKVRFLPGLDRWLGFKRVYVEVKHQERQAGTSSYNFHRRLTLGLDALISFSDIPLKIGVLLGSMLAVLGVLVGVAYIFVRIYRSDVLPGFTSLIAVMLFAHGATMSMLGVVGIYIGRILQEVQNRPLYVIRDKINFPSNGKNT